VSFENMITHHHIFYKFFTPKQSFEEFFRLKSEIIILMEKIKLSKLLEKKFLLIIL